MTDVSTEATDMAALYRDTLEAIRDALDIPHAATTGWQQKRQEILDRRLTEVVCTLRAIDMSDHYDMAWHAEYLRKRIAELPADGYVTLDEAHAAIARGADWMEAVGSLRKREICGPGCCSPVLGVHTACPGPQAGHTVESFR